MERPLGQLTLEESDFDFEGDTGEAIEGRGFGLRDGDDHAVFWDDPRLAQNEICITKVAGVSFRASNLQRRAFAPGNALALVPEPANEHDRNAVAVWDAARKHQIGYVPRGLCADIARRLNGGERMDALSLWEFRDESGKRCGLRVLIAPPGSFDRTR